MKRHLFFGFLMLGFTTTLHADIDKCKEKDPSQKDFVCGQCEKKDVEWAFGNDMGPEASDPSTEKNRETFTNGFLFDLNTKPSVTNSEGKSIKVSELKTVEDFVEFLPTKFKKDVVFISPSRSLQEGDRYLLKSPNSEIVMSFNSHTKKDPKSLRGGEAVEMQVWNGAKAVWEYVEISFSEGKPVATRNPDTCLRCHGTGTNTRPNFDPYNFWAETKPFFRDTLVPGTKDAKDYVSFLERVKKDSDAFKAGAPKTRYSILAAMLEVNPLDKIKKSLDSNEPYQLVVDTSSGFNTNQDGGQSVNLFDQMYLTNHCRLANLATNPKNNPLAPQLKYALTAAIKGCFTDEQSLLQAVPPEYAKNAKAFFKGKGFGQGTFDELKKQTETVQKDYYEDRIGRKLWTMESEQLLLIKESDEYKSELKKALTDKKKIYNIEMAAEKKAYTLAKKQLETLSSNSGGARDKEQSSSMVAPLRFLLEPLGIDTSMFSISVDPLSYTFGDFFFNIGRFGAFKELRNKSCSELKTLSTEALQGPEAKTAIANIQPDCRADAPGVIESAWVKDMTDIEKKAIAARHAELKPKVKETFTMCMECHSTGTFGAPPIPYENINELDGLLSKQSGEIGNLQTRIWKRIKRHNDFRGSMPMDMGQLEPQQLKDVKEYLETFPKRDYIEQINTGLGRNNIESVNTPKD